MHSSPAGSSRDLPPSLDGTHAALVEDRRSLHRLQFPALGSAVDKLLKVIACAKKRGLQESESRQLAIATARLRRKVILPLMQAGSGDEEVMLAPSIQQRIDIFSGRLSSIVDASPLSKSKSRFLSRHTGSAQDVASLSQQMNEALDSFAATQTMSAEVVDDGTRRVIILRDKTRDTPLQTPTRSESVSQYSFSEASDMEEYSTSTDILEECPRFRILVIGKTGTGKTSLINRTFNVNLPSVSHYESGRCNINDEITSPDNTRFVLHDSQGFEIGDLINFKTVKDFIRKRNGMPRLQDKIHAIWLCIQVPYGRGTVLEAGDEQFIKAQFELPVIVVFTKYDMLKRIKEKEMLEDPELRDLSDEQVDALVEEEARKDYQHLCLEPLRKATKEKTLPHTKVSVYDDASLSDLVQLTSEHAGDRVGAVWLTWAVAQRANLDLNIEASVAIGRKNYWRSISSGFHFWGKSLKDCLELIHNGIVDVWNFLDPNRFLNQKKVREKLWLLLEDLVESTAPNPNKTLALGVPAMTTVGGLVGGLSGPAAPIVLPVVGAAIFGKWLYDVYKQTPGITQLLMGYIIDLTSILEGLFILLQAQSHARGSHHTGPRPLTFTLVNLAINGYRDSSNKAQSHYEIKKWIEQAPGIWKSGHKDLVIEEIVRLTNLHRWVPGVDLKRRAKELVGGTSSD